jgi:hypothetical protein
MSAGSGASNLGYGNITPFSNINSSYANAYNTHNPYHFGSNEIPGLPGLAGAKNNVDAAAGKVPGICLFKGGAKKLKRKIKNITKKYKMSRNKNRTRNIKNRIKSKFNSFFGRRKTNGKRKTNNKRKTNKRRQRGGYGQYQNNLPLTQNYSVGGVLSADQLGLANPPPISLNKGGCVDNYNHFTGTGFASRGH